MMIAAFVASYLLDVSAVVIILICGGVGLLHTSLAGKKGVES